jgi:superfamily II DNA or RNA helicase
MTSNDLFTRATPLKTEPPCAQLPGALRDAPHEHRDVMIAFALGAMPRSRSWIGMLLPDMGAKDAQGRRYTAERVRDGIHALCDAGQLREHPQRPGFWRLESDLDNTVLAWILDHPYRAALTAALERVDKVRPHGSSTALANFSSPEAAVAVLRLSLFSGDSPAALARWHSACRWMDWNALLDTALSTGVQPSLLRRLHPVFLAHTLQARLTDALTQWVSLPAGLHELASELLAAGKLTDDLPLRMSLVEHLAACDRLDGLEPLLHPLLDGGRGRAHAMPQGGELPGLHPGEQASPDPHQVQEAREAALDARHAHALAHGVKAACLAWRGQWPEAEAAYEQALSDLKHTLQRRKNLLPITLLWPYLQCLLAQQARPQHDKALKLCLAEAGQRKPTPDSPWGIAALALQMQQGDAPRDAHVFAPRTHEQSVAPTDLWAWQMRAWARANGGAEAPSTAERERAHWLLQRLQAVGLKRLQGDLSLALAVLDGAEAPPTFFVPPPRAAWQTTLSALAALAEPATASAAAPADGAATRLVWVLSVDDDGRVRSLTPTEQKRGARGWGRAQPVSLWKLSRMTTLAPHDAVVARSLKQPAYASTRDVRMDLPEALAALVGHPHLEFDEAPGVAVALSEGTPELDLVDEGERLRLVVRPSLRPLPSLPRYADAGETKAAEALAGLSVLRDGPDRARLVRFSPAQRRAAQLLGTAGLAVPRSAAAQLQPVLQSLAAHFQVQADHEPEARDVPASARLRAELTPQGDGLRLRLTVAPVGPDGPRLAPGQGRPRLMARVRGETLAARRDLAAERQHLASVLDACPMLVPRADGQPAEFELDDPESALALVEALASSDAVESLDWPTGRRLSVVPATLGQLQVRVRSRRDWLSLDGGVRVDESLVVGIEQLLQWQADAPGRFVPLGEGRFLALTQELRARIADLAAVAETTQDGARVPALAAGWLDAALAGSDWQSDEALRRRVDRLMAARDLRPAVPSTLQAELRPYQSDGVAWALRLASAGCGACLADDMGLGKTLQALAVLLARAADGPALVVAPTSLIGNWQAEAARFAPTLQVRSWGDEADRAALLLAAGAHHVVLLSYPLLQLNAEAFQARGWHTLVLDEAQALKNAATKRSQAAQALQADFTLALSGTPVENRLAELWAIMRVCNPGLLGSAARFNDRFATRIERDGDREAQRLLRRLIAPFVLRRTKAQVLHDLPPRTELALSVQPDDAERAHYEALRRQALAAAERSLAQGGGQAQINVLAQLMRLRRAACDPRLVSPELGITGAKVQAFAELALELAANGHKALVFSQFVDFLALLRQPLDEAGIPYQVLDGSTPSAERTRRVAAFQRGEGTLFLISLKAGGFGLNLTAADYVVIADPWWNPAAEDQASGRAHRIGQQRPVTVYRLVSAGTIEERIVELHQHKRALADGVLEAEEGTTGAPLDAQALVELIRG